jgi:hypothetical protein
MVHINLFLWLAMFGAAFGTGANPLVSWTAAAGLAVAAAWEHASVRGFLKRTPGQL